MLSRVRTRTLDGRTRARLLKKDREGVASTVGTIMALLVFLAFMTLITNSYVPAWMLDNERAHMNQVTDQFGELKGKVDSMVVQWTVRGGLNSNMYAPVALGSDGVPLFAVPTIGILTYSPMGSSNSNISMSFTKYGDPTPTEFEKEGGRVELYCPNRYYVQQWLAYENGAILVKQEDGQTMRAFPNLEFTRVNGLLNIRFTQVDLIGEELTLSGSDSVGLNLNLIYVDMQSYNLDQGKEWTLTLTTAYASAWQTYFNESLGGIGLIKGAGYDIDVGAPDPKTGVSVLTLTVSNVSALSYDHAIVKMTAANP